MTEKKSKIPKKLYYKIGEACKALDIQPYVLRYWETEFPFLNPSKSKSGQRVYTEQELSIIRRVKELLYEEGYTIAGAKKKLGVELEAGTAGKPPQKKRAANIGTRAGKRGGGAASVDSSAAQRVETLRKGIRKALNDAQEILALLDSESPKQ